MTVLDLGGSMEPNLQHDIKPTESKPTLVDEDSQSTKESAKATSVFDRERLAYYYNQTLARTKVWYQASVSFCKDKKNEIRQYSLMAAGMLFVVVLFQNIESSQFEFLFWSFSAPKIVLFLVMIGIGATIGYLASDKMNKSPNETKDQLH